MTRFWDGRTDRQTDGQTDGVTALLDLLSPSATQVKTLADLQGTKIKGTRINNYNIYIYKTSLLFFVKTSED